MFNSVLKQNTPLRHIAKLLRAAVLPFTLSISVMSVGCPLGIPFRFAFDALNIALLLSFMTSVVRLFRGNHTGLHTLGFSYPHFRRSNSSEIWPLIKTSAWVFLSGMAVFVVLTINIAPTIAAVDNIVVTVTSRVTPMYILGALLGVTIASRTPQA